MKNIYTVIINRIIHDLKWVSIAVKAYESVFLWKSFNREVIYFGFESMENILLADTMPKRRFVELNDNFHALTII